MTRAKGPKLFLLLERSSHAVRQRLERRAREELDASMAQVGALFHLSAHDGCLAKELAEALGIQPAGVSGLVDRMQNAGLVVRKACAEDGRAQRLHITAAGKRAVTQALPLVAQMQSVLTEGFSEAEIAVVVRFLTAAIEREL